ncbi:MAG: hypothetical protein HOP19_18220 [Acidobacteria bacterium]|nr:hypothetical protein [Acidobacteriota bacterium]
MSLAIAPRKTSQGWMIDLPDDMAEALNVAHGSIALLYVNDGNVETELLPPPTDELKDFFERTYAKYSDTFKELKRLGD